MQQSESIENLAKALIGLQAEMPVAPYDSENKHFHHRYASLTSIWSVCRPLLAKHELGIMQLPVSSSEDGSPTTGLSTRLVHVSGEYIEDTVFIPLDVGPRAIQAAGSIITYLRRYSLAALLGVVTDEDSDGEPPGNNGQQPKTKVTPKKATAAQLKKFNTLGTKFYGDAWDDKRPDMVKWVTDGRESSSLKLTGPEISELIKGINDKFANLKPTNPRLEEG